MKRRRAHLLALFASVCLTAACAGQTEPVDPSEYEDESIGGEATGAAVSAAPAPSAPDGATGGTPGPAEVASIAPNTDGEPAPPDGEPAPPDGEPASAEAPTEAGGRTDPPEQAKTSPAKNAKAKPDNPGANDTEANGEVVVVMTGFEHADGQVLVALWRTGSGFPQKADNAHGKKRTWIRGERARVTFDDVPPGPFAVVVHHDEDKDFEMDTGMMGIPAEGYGFSRNAQGTMGPPSFEDARVWLKRGQRRRVRIKLRY